jgi:hypothetical protein
VFSIIQVNIHKTSEAIYHNTIKNQIQLQTEAKTKKNKEKTIQLRFEAKEGKK